VLESPSTVRLYENSQEIKTLTPMPEPRRRKACIAFAPDGSLVYACDTMQDGQPASGDVEVHVIELYSVQLTTGLFRKLGQYLHESTKKTYYQTGLESLAVGPKLPRPVADAARSGAGALPSRP